MLTNTKILSKHTSNCCYFTTYFDSFSSFVFNGKEKDYESDFHYYGARYYASELSIWLSTDPMSDKYPSLTPHNYCANNPVKLIDPNGEEISTHTDENGNVIAIFNDGDNGVYRHQKNADGGSVTAYQLNKRHKKYGTSAGGTKMGETWTPFGFADFSVYEKDGSIKVGKNAKIDFNSNWATEQVSQIIDKEPSLLEYAVKASSQVGIWDIKQHSPSGVYGGSLLFGKYASARDAGNFAAGAVAELSGYPNLAEYGYGLYNMSGNNPIRALQNIVSDAKLLLRNPSVGYQNILNRINNGEDKLSKTGISVGRNYIKSAR
ncbi:MAG: RHS repeat-associated core domain-containing protein [Bacteroidales bacterium]